MAFTPATLKSVINANGGPENVVALQFDTNGRIVFDKEHPFTMDIIDDASETIKWTGETLNRTTYTFVKNIDNITGVIFSVNPQDREFLNPRELLS